VGRLYLAQPPHPGRPNGVLDGPFAAQFKVGGVTAEISDKGFNAELVTIA
jgi:hypothetical protein